MAYQSITKKNLPVTAVAAVVLVAVGNFDSQHKLHNHTY